MNNLPYQLLKQNIANHIEFSETEFEKYSRLFHLKKVAKKDYILRQGAICKFEGFVTKGCFRVLTHDRDGNEHVLYFAIQDWWITDIDSFTNQIPSFLSIQALEDSEVLLINKVDKDLSYEQFPKVEKLFRIMTQKTIVAMQRRLLRKQSQTADERYSYFLNQYPEIANKLTNRQLASYLGISHEFLSKIRKKLVSKKQ